MPSSEVLLYSHSKFNATALRTAIYKNNNNNNMWLFKHNLKEVIDVTPYTLLCFKSGIYSREMSGCSKRCG